MNYATKYWDPRLNHHFGHCFNYFGPSKLPAIGRAFGSTLKEFKRATNDLVKDDNEDKDPSSDKYKVVAIKR